MNCHGSGCCLGLRILSVVPPRSSRTRAARSSRASSYRGCCSRFPRTKNDLQAFCAVLISPQLQGRAQLHGAGPQIGISLLRTRPGTAGRCHRVSSHLKGRDVQLLSFQYSRRGHRDGYRTTDRTNRHVYETGEDGLGARAVVVGAGSLCSQAARLPQFPDHER